MINVLIQFCKCIESHMRTALFVVSISYIAQFKKLLNCAFCHRFSSRLMGKCRFSCHELLVSSGEEKNHLLLNGIDTFMANALIFFLPVGLWLLESLKAEKCSNKSVIFLTNKNAFMQYCYSILCVIIPGNCIVDLRGK